MQLTTNRWNFKTILVSIVSLIGIAIVAFAVWFFIVTQNLPSEEQLRNYEPPIMSRVHAGDGKLVAEFATEHRVYVPSEELPDQLIKAFISAEDGSFFEHSGIDLWGTFRGAVLNPLMGRRQTGGSTITQQVVKNMLVGDERSIERKVREAVLAMRIEGQLTKEQILELYMNEIYLGGRSYGVGAAALNYFGKSLGQLTLAENAMLAGLPQAPGRVNPLLNPEAATKRRNYVIERMLENGYIDKAAAEAAYAEPLKVVDRLNSDENLASAYYVEELRKEILALGEQKKLEGINSREDASKALLGGGLSIRSTLDSNLQLIAQTALRAGLESYDRRHGWRGPLGTIAVDDKFGETLKKFANEEANKVTIGGAGNDWRIAVVRSVSRESVRLGLDGGETGTLHADDVKWAASFKRKEGGSGLKAGDVIFVAGSPAPDITVQLITEYGVPKNRAANAPWRLRQVPAVQGALVAMDPHTGRVLAMTGGYSFVSSKFNRAIQAKRQPGSSFKPFVYAAAMETPDPATGFYKWTPSYRVLDTPYVSCQTIAGEETCYKPMNYSEQFYGLTPLRIGVEKSRNAMTVRLASEIGFEKVSEMGERLGIYDDLPPYESMALGAGDTTLMRMAVAYAETVNGGKQVRPVMFDRIQNRYGKTVFRTDQRPCQGCATEWKGGLAPPPLPDERKQVLDPVTAYQIVSILEGAVQRGTGTTIRSVGKPVAAKTGTTNDQFDAWTMGFSPDLVAGVWVGFDTPRDMGAGESGGRVAAPIFRDFMLAALKDRPAVTFRVPNGVEHVEVDADTGCQPGPDTRLIITEAFRPGSAPTDRCEAPVGADGYRVDFSKVSAGDETASSTRDGQVTSQPLPGTQPIDPTQPQPQPGEPSEDEDLTFDDGTF
ncbi:MAG: hypothetical protein RIR33_640 [Pseudomonadota bacterium]|jgi:penicillin-binding protein 1A